MLSIKLWRCSDMFLNTIKKCWCFALHLVNKRTNNNESRLKCIWLIQSTAHNIHISWWAGTHVLQHGSHALYRTGPRHFDIH